MQHPPTVIDSRQRIAPWRLIPCCCCLCPPLSDVPRIRRVGRIVRRAQRKGLLWRRGQI